MTMLLAIGPADEGIGAGADRRARDIAGAPLALTAVGDTIMPARSDRMPGSAESGVFSFSVTCIGPVTSTDVDRGEVGLDVGLRIALVALEVELDGFGIERRAVMEGHAGADVEHQRGRDR